MKILHLDLDTLRPDHLGCYGYHRNTSPVIDQIAAAGVRFDNYYCSDAPCLPSRSALMTGRFGIHTGVVGHGGTAADLRLDGAPREFHSSLAWITLPRIFRQQGMHTASISPFPERHTAYSFCAGFNEMHNTGRWGSEIADEITPVGLDWIKHNAARKKDWYLHVNYWDAHAYYRTPAAFGNPFANEPLADWLTPAILKEHWGKVGPNSAQELMMFGNTPDTKYPRMPGSAPDMESVRMMMDGYDCGVRYMDDHIGRLLDSLEKEGVLEETAIIISTDHGENLGELGIYAEHGTADQMTCRLPMIIKWPGGPKGKVDRELRYQLDLAPTLAELFGQEPDARWDGKSYAGVLQGKDSPGWDELIISQCAHVCQRSVRFGDWLYMRTYHDGYHLFPDEMLFNLKADPHETTDLATREPGVCADGARRLERWHASMMKSMTCPVDPLWTVMSEGGPYHPRGRLKAYCSRLEETGRGWAVPELKRRHPGEFVDQPINGKDV